MMKILEIIATADPTSGGPIEGLLRQIEATPGIERDIVTLDTENVSIGNIRVISTGQRYPRFKLFSPIIHYGYSPQFTSWLRRNAKQYDAIVVNGLWNFSSFGAATVLPALGVPYFVFTHGMLDPWFRKAYPLKHAAKILFWLAGDGRLLAGARAVLFTTEEERVLARGQFPIWKYKEEVVGYGTARPPEASRAQSLALLQAIPSLRGRPYILFMSRIHRKKGCDLLIEAFAQVYKYHPDMQLVVAGPDQEGLVDALKVRSRALGVEEQIHWPGMLSGDSKWGALRSAEAFILPSHQENFGIVIAEALSCALPVLTTKKVNTWREVSENGAGFVENDDLEGVMRLLTLWAGAEEATKEAMRNAAVETFSKYFDVSEIGPQIISRVRALL